MIAIVKDEEIQRIGYYAVIPATVLFNERLKPNEKLLYALITALSNKEGYCYATNKYLGEKLGVDPVTVSRWITDLRRNNYVFVDIMRNEKKEIICRRIFPNDVPYRLNNQYPYILKNQEGIDEKVKDNNIIDNNINTHTVRKEKFNENVFLYDYEYKKLLEEYGENKTKKCIEKTINYRNSLKCAQVSENGVITFVLKTGQNEEIPALRADEFLKTLFGDFNIFKIKRVEFFDTNLRVI